MDFLATARLLMDLQEKHPSTRYEFQNDWDGMEVVIRIPVENGVAQMFDDARKMFEPAD